MWSPVDGPIRKGEGVLYLYYEEGQEMTGEMEGKIAAAGPEARYDANAKRLLGEKIILAHILAGCVDEFSGKIPDEIIPLIEGEPEIGTVPIGPGESNSPHIRGMNAEDAIPYEGVVTYDIRFLVQLPGGKEKARIIIDIEAQQKFSPGYDIVTRGIYYGARLLSSQMSVEFSGNNYDQVKKVYSIFICMGVPKEIENSVTEYKFIQNNRLGNHGILGRYDLIRTLFIGLSRNLVEEKEEYRLHRLLETLLLPELNLEQRKDILEKEYQIPMSGDMGRRMNLMCNLSGAIVEWGMEKGIKEGMEKGQEQLIANFLKKNNHVSYVAEMLDVSEDMVRGVAEKEKIDIICS